MTSVDDLPDRLRKIGVIERSDHSHLPAEGEFYFWGEYTPYEHTAGKNWNFSKTNQLIANLKKPPDRRDQYDWRYKMAAIDAVATQFARTINWRQLRASLRTLVVPMPPSRHPNDPGYDPRMLHVVNGIQQRVGCDIGIRDCLRFDGSQIASHSTSARPTPAQLEACLQVVTADDMTSEQPALLVVVDDVLTTGAHFQAAKARLAQRFAGVPFIGLAVARRVTTG